MVTILDYTGAFFWSVAYIIATISGIKKRNERPLVFPLFAVLCNFSWETIAFFINFDATNLLSQPDFFIKFLLHNPIRTAWWIFDLAIVFISFHHLKTKKTKQLYLLAFVISFIIFFVILQSPYGMLYSSFIIDLTMANGFIISRKRIHRYLKIHVAVAKLAGDICAWLCYRQGEDRLLIEIIGIIVLVLNISYLIYCIYEKKRIPNETPKKRHPIKF